jgi:hypothetical protein
VTPIVNPHRKFALLYVPFSGLYHSGGNAFTDGRGNDIPFEGKLPVYTSHSRAEIARDDLRAQWPEREGDWVILRVVIDEQAERMGRTGQESRVANPF